MQDHTSDDPRRDGTLAEHARQDDLTTADQGRTGVTTGDLRREADAEAPSLVRHEEELFVQTRPVVTGTVRVTKRVVTEQRTVTVRREELVVEEIPAERRAVDTDDATTTGTTGNPAKDAALDAARPHQARGTGDEQRPVIEMVLHEERIVTETVPVERVRVFVDRVTHDEVVEADLAKEVITVEHSDDRTRDDRTRTDRTHG